MKEDQESLKLIERLIAEEKNQLKQQEDYDELMALKLQEFNRKTNKDYGIRNRNNQINYSEDCIIIDDWIIQYSFWFTLIILTKDFF